MRLAVFASDDSSQSPVSLILILMVKHIVNNWGGQTSLKISLEFVHGL